MWIVCQADNSHVMTYFLWKLKQNYGMPSAINFAWCFKGKTKSKDDSFHEMFWMTI